MKKLLVVYNPRSSKHAAIKREVLEPVRKLPGWMVGKYEVRKHDLKESAADLAKIIEDGDLVIAAGGDGTATMTLNGIMLSGKDAVLGVLGYGNFNDLARMLGVKRVTRNGDCKGGVLEIVQMYEAGKVQEIYPLEVKVNGKHWRYAPCYVSLGMFAESTAVFEQPEVREKLKTGKKHLIFSVWVLAKWYFCNRKREFLPESKDYVAGTTDYMAVNGATVAKVMRGSDYYRSPKVFWKTTMRLGNFWSLMGFMLRSMFWRVSGAESEGDVLKFVQASEVMIQTEGEYERLEGVKKIEVEKVDKGVKVVKKN